MKKRKRGEEVNEEGEHGGGSSRKKARTEEDALGKFLSLVEAGNSLAGLTYFLTAVQREDNSSLIRAYLLQYPSCEHILAPLQWERDRQTYDALLLCFQCLENILLHTASLEASTQSDSGTGMGPSPGHKLACTVLRDHMRPIYSSLMTSCPMKLVAACLRLLTAMVLQGHHIARDVQQNFNFNYKPLIVFPNRTHRVQGCSDSVRTCFIKFALSFLIAGNNDVIRNILDLKKFLSSVFKLLHEDSVEIIHLFLSTLQQKVLRNSGVSKRAKSALFNHYALKQLSGLLSPSGRAAVGKGKREGEERGEGGRKREEVLQVLSQESGEIVSLTLHEYVLEVLTELCTSFQYGVCYRTKLDTLLAERSNNPAILQLLLSLTGSLADCSVQGLITRALATCPDMLTPYLQTVSLSFEPRPHSKWIANVDFLINLLSGLPSVPETLGISGCGHDVIDSLVPVAVSLTVPRVMSRAMFNQGVQSPTPLVRLKTLRLMDVVLKRVAETVSVLKANEPDAGPTLSSVVYSDLVLKLLPVLKTLVNLRQQLMVAARPTVEAAKREGGALTHEQMIQNAALLETPTLLCQCLAVMRGYQQLSPSLFAQADFNPAKMLPSLSQLHTHAPGAHITQPSVMMATLKLLEEAPGDYFKWRQRKSDVLPSLLWMVVCGNREINRAAFNLTVKLLLSVEYLAPYAVEVGVVLAAARRFCAVCLSDSANGREGERGTDERGGEGERGVDERGGEGRRGAKGDGENMEGRVEEEEGGRGLKRRRKTKLSGVGGVGQVVSEVEGAQSGDDKRLCFVRSLAEMFSALAKEPRRFVSSNMEECSSDQTQSLQSILDAPLNMPTVSEIMSPTGEHTAPISSASRPWLLPALLSSIDCDKYFPFVCEVILKSLLGQDSSQSLSINARLLLSLKDNWKSRSWHSLYHSLVHVLHCWARDSSIDIEVDREEEDVVHLPSRKLAKKLKKLTAPSGMCAVELLSSMSCEQLLECVAATETRYDLRQALLYCFDLRPLHLLDCHDHPVVQDLLPSLPLPTLLLQSFQIEPVASPEHCGSPLLSLSCSLTQLPLELWLDSTLEGGEDSPGTLCAARAILATLLELLTADEDVHVESISAADVCFNVLCEILESLLTPTNTPEKHLKEFPTSLLATVFSSQLVQTLLSSLHRTSDSAGCESGTRNHRRKSRSGSTKLRAAGGAVEVVCIEGVGRLLSTALRCSGEFKRSACFSSMFRGLLGRIQQQTARERDEDAGGALLSVLKVVRPYLDSSSLLSATERILHTLTNSPSSPSQQSLLPQALLTLLTPLSSFGCVPVNSDASQCTTGATITNSESQNHTKSDEDAPVNHPTNGESSPIVLSDSVLQQLLEATVRTTSVPLSQSALYMVCSRLAVSPVDMSISKWSSLEWSSFDDLEKTSSCRRKTEICQHLAIVAERIAVKGLSPPFLCRLHDRFLKHPNQTSSSWLPHELLTHLLDISVGREASVTQCSLVGCALLHLPHRTLEYYSTTCVPELCSHAAETSPSVDGGVVRLETTLFLLVFYLTAILRSQRIGQDSQQWKDSVKMIRKSVWEFCSTVITTTDCSQLSTNIQGLSARVLCLLCQISSQARKRLRKLAEVWDSDGTPWTRHQVCVVGVTGLVSEDASLGAVAAGRLLRQVVCASTAEEEWREEGLRWLRGVWGILETESVNIQSHEWNLFIESSLSGGSVRLSSVLSGLCAGVKVLYGESGEGERRGRKRRREKGELVMLESIHSKLWAHSDFHDTMFSPQALSTKEILIELLVFVSERCSSVCDTNHIPTLLGAYSASRCKTDRGLLYLLLLYEINGANVGKFKPFLWGEAGRRVEAQHSEVNWLQWEAPGARQVLDSLDSQRMRHSLEHFPQHALLEPSNPFTAGEASAGSREGEEEEEEEGMCVVYDPAFMLPLLSHLLDPGGLVECRGVVESGAVSYLLGALSSYSCEVRMAATHCLSRFAAHLKASKCREKPQLSLLLRILKNTLEKQPQRLPSLHTAFCAQVAHVFLDPEQPLYTVVGHCIVYKPVLEVRDIPLFNTLPRCSSEQCVWLLGVLLSGLQSEEDYRLYQRKRVLPQLMALHTVPCMDDKARSLILKLLLRACSFQVAASDLVWNHGLLVWLTQFPSCDLVQMIISMVCRRGLKEREEDGSSVKLPPLLEEELALTACRLTRPV